jgi:hypothetical protein
MELSKTTMKEIPASEIEQYLGLYPPLYQLIKNAYYENGSLKAELIPFIYPFTTEDLDYITATQLHLFLSQLTYVLIGKSITDPEFTLLSKIVTYEDYANKMYAGRLFFAKLEQTMKRVIYKKNMPIVGQMKILNARKFGKTGFCEVEFDIGGGACFGNVLLSVQQNAVKYT